MSRAGAALLVFALWVAGWTVVPALAAHGLPGGGSAWEGEQLLWLGEHLSRWARGQATLSPATGVAFPTGVPLDDLDGVTVAVLAVPLRLALRVDAAWAVLTGAALAGAWVGAWALARRGLGVGPLPAAACAAIVGLDASLHAARIAGSPDLWARALLPFVAWAGLGAGASAARSLLLGALVGGVAWTSRGLALPAVAVALAAALPGRSRHLVWALVPAALLLAARGPGPSALPEGVPLASLVFPGDAGWIGVVALCAGLAGAAALPRRTGGAWAVLALSALLLALGPALRAVASDPGSLPLPGALLGGVGLAGLGPPLAWTAAATVGLAALTALLLDRLSRDGLGAPRLAAILALLVVDALAFGGRPALRPVEPLTLPAGYAGLSGEGAVLDLAGRDPAPPRLARRLAAYAAQHGAPTLADLRGGADRGERVGHRLADALLSGDRNTAGGILAALYAVGVRDIALHPRAYAQPDAERLRAALGALTKPVQARKDADADPVLVFHLPWSAAVDGPAALATLDALRP